MKSSIPEEIVYANDCDFITEMEMTKDKIYEKAKETMTSKNLLVNKEKTEYKKNYWDQSLVVGKTSREEKNWQPLPLRRITQSGKRIEKRN